MGLTQSSINTTVLNWFSQGMSCKCLQVLPLARSRSANILCCLKVNLYAFNMNRLATWLASCENRGTSLKLRGQKVTHSAQGSSELRGKPGCFCPLSQVLNARLAEDAPKTPLRRRCIQVETQASQPGEVKVKSRAVHPAWYLLPDSPAWGSPPWFSLAAGLQHFFPQAVTTVCWLPVYCRKPYALLVLLVFPTFMHTLSRNFSLTQG